MTSPITRPRTLGPLSIAALAAVAAGCSSGSSTSAASPSASSASQPLVGLFRLTPGQSTATGVTGTYFRMIYPGGTVTAGKFFDNPDSTATDKSYTVAGPGTAGGLVSGSYQPSPNPPFDASGSSLATAIIQPQSFTGIKFGIATEPVDKTTGAAVPAPTVTNKNGVLSGQVKAIEAQWNKLYFNQGSPKPDGSTPGITSPVTGTYDSSTHAFVLTWASQVVGGPFNGFTGYWHLEGTFVPKAQ
jgi:hypothetical protein